MGMEGLGRWVRVWGDGCRCEEGVGCGEVCADVDSGCGEVGLGRWMWVLGGGCACGEVGVGMERYVW